MEWIILIVIAAVFLIPKMASNYKQNKYVGEVMEQLERHSLEDIRDITQWEQKLRLKLVEYNLSLKAGEITDQDYEELSKELLFKHREIAKKYNITEDEMVDLYLHAINNQENANKLHNQFSNN